MTGTTPPREALRFQLAMLTGREPIGGLLEVRQKMPTGGMKQLFHACDRGEAIIESVFGFGRRTDVFVGVCPRGHRHGGLDAIERAWALWADCDTPDAVDALRHFDTPPSLIIRSGTDGNVHAYWSLREPVPAVLVRRANLRLAHALGSDLASTDAARILRPAGTLNHKHAPPRPVDLAHINFDAYYWPRDVTGHLPDPPATDRAPRPMARPLSQRGDDPLQRIPAAEYIPVLTGRDIGRDGKVQCPFHAGGQERTPSLHVYDDGWACFGGCQSNAGRDHAGGGIIEFAARLYGRDPRGAGYHELRTRLAGDLLRSAA